MTKCSLARSGRFLVLLVAAAPLVACMSVDTPQQPRSGAQPRLASYSCGEDGQLRVESAGGLVRVSLVGATDPKTGERIDTEPVELPASPPGQSTRFGKEGYALVIEGREALYMKAGRVPLTCTR